MRKNSKNLLLLLAGAAVGLVGGLLFAPARGVSIRNILTYKVKRYAEKLQELIKTLMHSHTANVSQAKAASQEVINETIQKAQQLLADANDLAEVIENS